MSSALRISEATSLAMHTMAMLAHGDNGGMTSKDIASVLSVSQAHLQKVLQRLGHSGLVRSERGPKGGFTLARSPERITLLEVYESIEGPLHLGDCLLGRATCARENCVLGGLVASVNGQFSEYLRETTLADLAPVGSAGAAGKTKGDER